MTSLCIAHCKKGACSVKDGWSLFSLSLSLFLSLSLYHTHTHTHKHTHTPRSPLYTVLPMVHRARLFVRHNGQERANHLSTPRYHSINVIQYGDCIEWNWCFVLNEMYWMKLIEWDHITQSISFNAWHWRMIDELLMTPFKMAIPVHQTDLIF